MIFPAFLLGSLLMFYVIFSIHILCFKKDRTRFLTVLGYIMIFMMVWNLKDTIIFFPGMYRPEIIHWIMVIDGWSAIAYAVFLFEAVEPGWTTARRMLLHSVPFALFTVWYALQTEPWVLTIYTIFLWTYALSVVLVAYLKMRRQQSYLLRNYSNIECIDSGWLKKVLVLSVVSQVSWYLTSIKGTILANAFYYVACVVLWLIILYYSWNYRPVKMVTEVLADKQTKLPIADGELERVVEEGQLYLNPNLTVSDLAQALNTNRTYVSTYLSQKRGQTFYDYINELRITEKSIPLMEEHPEYKLEYVAAQSGFSSMATFRRAFARKTGEVPSQFAEKMGGRKP